MFYIILGLILVIVLYLNYGNDDWMVSMVYSDW